MNILFHQSMRSAAWRNLNILQTTVLISDPAMAGQKCVLSALGLSANVKVFKLAPTIKNTYQLKFADRSSNG